jgi:A/G-specific adenine glycosylase
MCQQTQIATVLPYFERFITRYPNATMLADAHESELMRMWEGLGYYRRARSMHAAAKQIVQHHDGEFPQSYLDALALPGIGRYTAGAILSISSNQRLPILEGNTLRVFSRIIGCRAAIDEKPTQDHLWKFAEQLLPRGGQAIDRTRGPASLNQAAMELGALICTPREPKCLICPVAKSCFANQHGLQTEIPVKASKTKYEARDEFAAIITDTQGRWLVRQLPPDVRFAGMWDFPKAGPPEAHDLAEFEVWLGDHIGGRIQFLNKVTTIKHAVTKYRITLHAHQVQYTGVKIPDTWKFCSAEDLNHRPMSTTGRRLLGQLQKIER